MLKPREFVPWGLPGPTRGRRDAAALASKTKGTARMGGRVGVGPTDYTSPLPMQPSGRPWASKRTPGRGVNKQHSIFYVWRGRCQCATSIYYYSYIYRASRGISGVGVTITLLCPRSMPA